jgi:hypothetical protein
MEIRNRPRMMAGLAEIEDLSYMTRAFSRSELSSSSSLLVALIAAIWPRASSSLSGISILYHNPTCWMDLPNS